MGVWKESHNDFQADHVLSLAGMCMARCRQLSCVFKSTPTRFWDNKLTYYNRDTCGFLLRCNTATERVSSRCNDWAPELTRDYLSKEICSKIDNLTPTGVKVPLYLTGKADCADNNQSNNWMDPVKKADVCCAAIPFLGVVGCKNDGVDKLCKC